MFLPFRNSRISICSLLLNKTGFSLFSPHLQLQNFQSVAAIATTSINLPGQENVIIDHGQEPTNLPKKRTAAYYDELIAIASRARDLNTVKNLLDQRVIDGYFNTRNTFNFLTEYINNESALEGLVKELTETVAKLASGYGKKNAFDCLIISLCKPGLIDLALSVMKYMFDGKHATKNAYTFNPLIAYYCRRKETEKLKEVFQFMKDRGIPPDLTCYNHVLTTLCHLGRLSEAADLLGMMVRKEESLGAADSNTFDALVLGACRARKMEGAVALLKRMDEDGVKGLHCTYSHIISGFMHLGRFDEALGFVVEVSGNDHLLDIENFAFLGRRLVRRKMVEEARLVLREMENRGLNCRQELGRLLADLDCEKL